MTISLNNIDADAERALWDRLSEDAALSVDELPAESLDLAANVKVVDAALRSLESLEEPVEMRSAIQAALEAPSQHESDVAEVLVHKGGSPAGNSPALGKSATVGFPSRRLQPRWALAAAALLVVGAAGVLMLRSSSEVTSEVAVGAMGARTDVAVGGTVEILRGPQGVVVELEPVVHLLEGQDVVVLHVSGLVKDQQVVVRELNGEQIRTVAVPGSDEASIEVALSLEVTLSLAVASGGFEIAVDGASVAGRVSREAQGDALRWFEL